MPRRTDIEQFKRQISLSRTLFGARIGTTLAEETLVFTSCEQNFVQLSNVQAVFSANAAQARSLQCFSYYAPLPFPSLMEFFQTSALEVHLQLSIRLTLRLGIAGDVTLARHTRTFEFKYPIPLKVTSVSSRIFSNFCFYNDLSDKVWRWKSSSISSFWCSWFQRLKHILTQHWTLTYRLDQFAVQTLQTNELIHLYLERLTMQIMNFCEIIKTRRCNDCVIVCSLSLPSSLLHDILLVYQKEIPLSWSDR